MKVSTHSHRIAKLAAAAFAVAAVAVPVSQAANRPDDRPGMRGATPAVAIPDVFERAAARGHVNLRGSRFDRPDNRPGTLGVGVLDRPAESFYTPEALKADALRWQGLTKLDRPASSYSTEVVINAGGPTGSYDAPEAQPQFVNYAGGPTGSYAVDPSSVAVPDVFERAVQRGPQGQPSLHPNDRPGVLGPGEILDEPSPVSTGGNSFNWDDALVGGATGIGIAFLLVASAMAAGSHRRRVLRSA